MLHIKQLRNTSLMILWPTSSVIFHNSHVVLTPAGDDWHSTDKHINKHISDAVLSVSGNSDRKGQVKAGTSQATAAVGMVWHSLTAPWRQHLFTVLH